MCTRHVEYTGGKKAHIFGLLNVREYNIQTLILGDMKKTEPESPLRMKIFKRIISNRY
jgi:acetolactate synthase small subunit